MVKSSCTQVTRWSASVIRVGVAYMNVHVSRHLKEELSWPIDKQLWLIINTMLSSSGDLQPSTAIANQLPGQLVYT